MTTTALQTDRYELTMVDAALHAGLAETPSVFELFARKLPEGRRYGVVAGTGRLLEALQSFRFDKSEIDWLHQEKIVSPKTLAWLENYRFTGSVYGYREGEVYFPGSPILSIHSSFTEGVLLETLALSIMNYDSAVASAAARMVSAANGRPLAEMGSRRTGEHSALAAARAAYIAGFTATSNLEAGRSWGIPTMGTAAHAFTLLFPSEAEAFAAQVARFGAQTTLLIDTYDIFQGLETAIRMGGKRLGAVRIDSGDLGTIVQQVREMLDKLGAYDTRITVTNDLDEYAIAALASTPVDSYGVGTALVTGSGAPAAGMVYKLVARQLNDGDWISVGKTSPGKASPGGQKTPIRGKQDGYATSEDVYVTAVPPKLRQGRELYAQLVSSGEIVPWAIGHAGVRAARAHHALAIAELPPDAFRLSKGEAIIPTHYR